MGTVRGVHKVERVTVTLLPRGDTRTAFHVPSTYNQTLHSYSWRQSEDFDYMIVPTHVSSKEVRVDLFFNVARSLRQQTKDTHRLLRHFVESKIESEWKGLRLGSIGRASVAPVPRETLVRGAIEEILGSDLEA
jgi:hypothetical protein